MSTEPDSSGDNDSDLPVPLDVYEGHLEHGGDEGEENNDSTGWTRRKVLQGAGAVAVGAGAVSMAQAAPHRSSGGGEESLRGPQTVEPLSSDDPFEQPGHPSRSAYRALAEAEREYQLKKRKRVQQQQGANPSGEQLGSPPQFSFSNKVNAVEDLGADPNGNEPVGPIIEQAASDGTLLVFPPGRYKLTRAVQAQVDGTFGIVGQGHQDTQSPPKPSEAAVFVAPGGAIARINYSAKEGVMGNFVMDQSNTNASISFVAGSSGFTRTHDIAIVGVVDDTGSKADEAANHVQCALIAESGATARVVRFVSNQTGIPGDKNTGGVPALWVGKGNKGKAQIVDCIVKGAADNGIYGARTPGDTHIVGGLYQNNEVSQIRYSGQGSFADGVTLKIDANNYGGPTAGGGYNTKFATNGVKIEQPEEIDKPGGAVLRNADIQGISSNSKGVGALVFVRGHGGALKMENCRVVDALEASAIYAERPGGSYAPAAEPPLNLSISNVMITGNPPVDDVVQIRGRENSSIVDSCINIPGAGPQSISGASVTNVGYGENCISTQGLSDPGAVGSTDLGNITIPPSNFTGGDDGFDINPKKAVTNIVKGSIKAVINAFVLFLSVLIAILVALIVVGLIIFHIYKKYIMSRFS